MHIPETDGMALRVLSGEGRAIWKKEKQSWVLDGRSEPLVANHLTGPVTSD